jgi:hypothetical protein
MKRHEKGCTANPDRDCGLCAEAGLQQQPIADLIAALGAGDKAGVEAVRDLAEGCPACTLAAIRQSGLQRASSFDDDGFSVPFDFKAEMKDWWDQRNNERSEDYY